MQALRAIFGSIACPEAIEPNEPGTNRAQVTATLSSPPSPPGPIPVPNFDNVDHAWRMADDAYSSMESSLHDLYASESLAASSTGGVIPTLSDIAADQATPTPTARDGRDSAHYNTDEQTYRGSLAALFDAFVERLQGTFSLSSQARTSSSTVSMPLTTNTPVISRESEEENEAQAMDSSSSTDPADSPNGSQPFATTEFTTPPTTFTSPQPEPEVPNLEGDDTLQESGESASPNSHFFLYIPQSVSPFQFGFFYDAATSLAWPILERRATTDNANEEHDAPHVLGHPFRLSFSLHTEPPEKPDPQKAAAFVHALEHVDEELRSRMGRLGLSDIGLYGAVDEDNVDGPAVGCGICLEVYPKEDTPAWFAGHQNAEDQAVVVIPCAGCHTAHASCLRSWLANKVPSQWTCPFCRAPLTSGTQDDDSMKPALREVVRKKERAMGWRCDAPACLPQYDDADSDLRSTLGTEMTTLAPCHHEIHLDCLCTGMRIESGMGLFRRQEFHVSDDDDESVSASDHLITRKRTESDYESETYIPEQPLTPHQDTVGKWITCPTCRKDAWANVPTKRCPVRSERHSHP